MASHWAQMRFAELTKTGEDMRAQKPKFPSFASTITTLFAMFWGGVEHRTNVSGTTVDAE